jgi:hypothetical protein
LEGKNRHICSSEGGRIVVHPNRWMGIYILFFCQVKGFAYCSQSQAFNARLSSASEDELLRKMFQPQFVWLANHKLYQGHKTFLQACRKSERALWQAGLFDWTHIDHLMC